MQQQLEQGIGTTIFALATAHGRAGVAVFRISGPGARDALLSLSGKADTPPARTLTRCQILAPRSGEILDAGMVVWFPQPASFTGEDVVELHVHGGRATADAIAATLSDCLGLRLAEPGEFLKRAFYSGKIDLTAAEAVADLVEAETAEQRRHALRQLDGALFKKLEAWRVAIIEALARLEAWIDFPDEALPSGLEDSTIDEVKCIEAEIIDFLDDNRRGEILRDGLKVAILGAPNAGKSSLLNALAERDAAIVSDTAGTTRDVIEVRLDVGGWPVILSDTAGLHRTDNYVEKEGVRRALEIADGSDLRLVVFDPGSIPDKASLEQLKGDNTVIVENKVDLGLQSPKFPSNFKTIRVSAKTGEHLGELLSLLQSVAEECLHDGSLTNSLTRARHREALIDCTAALKRASAASGIEFLTEDIRIAARALGRVTGRVDVEEILDQIFSEFCIGK